MPCFFAFEGIICLFALDGLASRRTLPAATVSQHLAKMRLVGMVSTRHGPPPRRMSGSNQALGQHGHEHKPSHDRVHEAHHDHAHPHAHAHTHGLKGWLKENMRPALA